MSACVARRPRPRWPRTVVLVVLGACHTWRVQPVPPAQLLSGASPSQVRLTLHDGRRVVIRQPVLHSDSVASGADDTPPLAVAEIDSIALRKGDPAKTMGLVMLIVGVPVILCAATCVFGPDFSVPID
jgi:hypothetical protein